MTELRKLKLGEGDLTTDVYGIQRVSQDITAFDSLFTFDIPPLVWELEEDGAYKSLFAATRVFSIEGRMDIKSGAVAGEKALLSGRNHTRYQAARGVRYSSSLGFKGANLHGILRAGLMIGEEQGFYFKTKGNGALYACIRRGGVETHEEPITLPFSLDITLGNLYDIRVQWGSGGYAAYYAAEPSTGKSTEIHRISFLNILDEQVITPNPSMTASYLAENISQEVSLWSGWANVTIEGGEPSVERYLPLITSRVVSSGAGIFAFRVPPLVGGNINTRDTRLLKVKADSDKKVTLSLYFTNQASAIIGGTWGTFFPGSYAESNNTMTSVSLAASFKIATLRVAAGGSDTAEFEFKRTGIDAVHGDIVFLVADNASTADIGINAYFSESI